VIKTPKTARRVVPSLATGWSHARGRKPLRVVPCSWQATARDPDLLGASLETFVGHPAYGTAQLRQDLNRFIFLLGGDDGESLFGHGPAE
jgi:hypothetical protein